MRIDSFELEPGEIIHAKYEILEKLGEGWEGEVYLVKELATGIERTAKFFFPQQNKHSKSSKFYAKKLHKLRHCDIIIHYHFQDMVFLKDEQIIYLISELIEGEMLSEFVERLPGKKLNPFLALSLLHSLTKGLESVHALGEYHGDLHTDNIMINRRGLGFDVKLLDLYNFGSSNASLRKDDIIDLINIFHEVLGGKKTYSKLPKEIKEIICGLKRTLILQKFPTIRKLTEHIENIEWE